MTTNPLHRSEYLLEKLIVSKVVHKCPAFITLKDLLHCLQQPATHPVLSQLNPVNTLVVCLRSIFILSSDVLTGLPRDSSSFCDSSTEYFIIQSIPVNWDTSGSRADFPDFYPRPIIFIPSRTRDQ